MDLRQHIRQVPDFPRPGINFCDITSLFGDAAVWRETVRQLASVVDDFRPELLVGIEARGFVVAAALSLQLETGFQIIRKAGKLPGSTITETYSLEYGTDSMEIRNDVIRPGLRVVIVDDVLATGGTISAARNLLTRASAQVAGSACIIELDGLDGRRNIGIPFRSLLTYDA